MQQNIYPGGLGSESDQLSSHLRGREVEGLLGEVGVEVTVLRAGISVGSDGISWETTRQLVDHLPAMVAPKWVSRPGRCLGQSRLVRIESSFEISVTSALPPRIRPNANRRHLR